MITPDNITEDFEDAILSRDEDKIRSLTIKAMQFYLEDPVNFTKDVLDGFASLILTVPIHENWETDYEFNDSKLKYVLNELMALEVVPDKDAMLRVKRFILYLEGKDYEHIK